MPNDREQELERLEKELLETEVLTEDDLLADIPTSLLFSDTDTPFIAEEDPVFEDEEPLPSTDDILKDCAFLNENNSTDEDVLMSQPKTSKKTKAASKRKEDRWQIALMAIASFLCLGIIGVLIYWLEFFLK